MKIASTTVKEGELLDARVVATNSGRATWLPRSSKRGAVLFGCHLLDAPGLMLNADFFRHPLTPGDGRHSIAPGETVTLEVNIPAPAKGSYVLECDLVSEAVGWFAMGGSAPARTKIQVN